MQPDLRNSAIVMVPTEQMKSMKQLSLAETGFLPKTGKQTRKAVFLVELEMVVPCTTRRRETAAASHSRS